MASAMSLPPWPPAEILEPTRNKFVTVDARDYALRHGLVYRALPAEEGGMPPQDTTIHAPLTLLPTPFPRDLFEKAMDFAPLYNTLYARVATDKDFLSSVLQNSVVHVDDFQRRLYEIWTVAEEEGTTQSTQLALCRSDYLVHMAPQSTGKLRQVEFNTISASFGALCTLASQMHHFLFRKGAYDAMDPLISKANMPKNEALSVLVSGLADAHNCYVKQQREEHRMIKPAILFVVQPEERNTFDQRALEMELLEEHAIPVLRASLDELGTIASLHGVDRILAMQSPISFTPIEISVVYFRAGYSPTDYKSDDAWATRLLLERSHAIKCPSIAMQLAGAKKVQQVLAEPGVLEHYLGKEGDLLRSTFAKLWPMDDSPLGKEGMALLRESPQGFVLKPQREGGSNNIYKDDIIPALDAMEARDKERNAKQGGSGIKEREGYILMSLIRTPENRGSLFMRAGKQTPGSEHATETVSELGVFGTMLYKPGPSKKAPLDMLSSRTGGYLLRTKASESNEGGVAAGFSVIDSPLLF